MASIFVVDDNIVGNEKEATELDRRDDMATSVHRIHAADVEVMGAPAKP